MSDRRSERGSTLIEMVIVCSILGLALLISAPNLSGYLLSQSADKGLQALRSQLDLARQRAITHRNPVEIILRDPDDSSFWSFDDQNSNGVLDNAEPSYGPFTLPRGVTFDDLRLNGDGRLVFLPSGMLQAGQGGPITVLDSHGRARTLNILFSGMTREVPPAQ